MTTCAGCAKDDKGAAKSRRRANAMVETGLSGDTGVGRNVQDEIVYIQGGTCLILNQSLTAIVSGIGADL
jgi:hypothetical protein